MAIQYVVQGLSSALTSVASQIFLVRVPFDCTLKEVEISLGSEVPEGQQAVFDVNAGASAAALASLFPVFPNKPKATAGQTAAVKTGLNIALPKGFLTVDVDSVPLGGISAPVFLSLTIEDGLPAGVTVEGAEDVPLSVLASKIVVNPADLTALGGGAVRVVTPSDILGVANGAARLDGGGKLFVSQLPAIALVNRFVVADEAARLALAAADVQPGDFAFQVDESEVYLLTDADPSDPASWALWLHPAIPTTLPPSGAAGGDLSGDYPNPTVSKLQGRSLAGVDAVPTGGVSDNFNDNSLDSSLWTALNAGFPIVEQNQRLEITTYGGAGYTGFYTPQLNFTNKTATFKLTLPNPIANNNDLMFGIGPNPEVATGENFSFWRFSTGVVRAFSHHNSNGDTFGANTSLSMAAGQTLWFRIFHDSAAGVIRFSYSGDGDNFTELDALAYSNGHPNLTACRFGMRMTLGASGPVILDDFVTDIPASDPIATKNLFAVLWDNAGNRFALMRALGLVPLTSGAPSGAPSNVPAGYGVLMYDQAAHILYAWNGETWDSQAF